MTTTQTFLCSTCSVYFSSDNERREHMRGAWHVYNMQRRIVELPPIPRHVYDSMVSDRPDASNSGSFQGTLELENTPKDARMSGNDDSNSVSREKDAGLLSPAEQCLFCSSIFENVDKTLKHMATSHGFSIPRIDALQTDLETFLAYIGLVISRFHCCLYCGHEKTCTEAVKAHMLAKGHCMLDLSEGSEFLEFWNAEDDERLDDSDSVLRGQPLSANDMRLPSGSIVSSRRDSRLSTRPSKTQIPGRDEDALALLPQRHLATSTPTTDLMQSQPHATALTLSRRDQMGLIGLSDTQRRALASVQKRMIACDQRSRNEMRWALEKGANKVKQKHFKVSPGGGVHAEFC